MVLSKAMRACLVIALLIAGCASSPTNAPRESNPRTPARSSTSTGGARRFKDGEPKPIPADLKAAVEQSIRVGVQIHLQDQAGSIATDVLLASVKTLEGQGLGGYLAMRNGDPSGRLLPSWTVLFFSNETVPRVRYRVGVPMEKGMKPTVETLNPPEPTPPLLATTLRARQLAVDAVQPVTRPLNPVVFPAELLNANGYAIYLLAAQTEPNTIVLGKHYRVLVSADATAVKSVEPLSRGDLVLSTKSPEGALGVAMVAAHVVTDYPLETHVFASLSARLPIYVVTRRGLWVVDGDSILFISDKMPETEGPFPQP